jgi:hypothetical protein
MNNKANKKFSENFNSNMGNYNPNFFNNPEGSAAVNFGYQLGKQYIKTLKHNK